MGGKLKSRLSEHAGKVLNWQKETNGISGKTERGRFLVTIYREGIFRIQITREDFFEEFSYSVVASPTDVRFDVADSQDVIMINTGRLVLLMGKDPLSFHFQDLQGRTINQDEESFGTSWIGEQVTTYKKLQEGERFIGLGEKTGPLDRRGQGYTNWNTEYFG